MVPFSQELKSQPIRVLDVFVIGPLMLWGGVVLRSRGGSPVAGWALALFGASTIAFNAYNYRAIEQARAAPSR